MDFKSIMLYSINLHTPCMSTLGQICYTYNYISGRYYNNAYMGMHGHVSCIFI